MNVNLREADGRRLAIAKAAYAFDAEPVLSFGRFQRRGQVSAYCHHPLIVYFELGIGRILSKIGDALHHLPVVRFRFAPEHLRADAGLPTNKAELDELLDRLAHRETARAELFAQLHLGRHEVADRVVAGSDLIDQSLRDLSVARLRRGRHSVPVPCRLADGSGLTKPRELVR